jgi:hypothetical protein
MYTGVMNMKKRKAKMGRPPIPEADRRDVFTAVRLTRAERAALEAEAKRAGVTVSEIIKRRLRGEG